MGTVEKSTDLLFALSADPAPRALTSLSEQLGWPKPSTHRLLRSLMHRSLVAQDASGGYCLGPGLVTLGLCASSGDPLIRACHPALTHYSRLLGETLFLVTARAGELLISHKVEGTSFLRASPTVGERLPPHATAAGRLFLAFAPERVSVSRVPQRFTPATLHGKALLETVQREKRQGYAVSQGEWSAELSAVAAPVLSAQHLLGTIALACTTTRLKQISVSKAVQAVLAAANQAAERCSQ